jgi:ParB family chromosome partitioning protein
MARKSGLGKGGGLGALISTEKVLEINENKNPLELDINMVEPNREQPRKNFDKEKLDELASSVKEHGMISPIIVVKEKDYYKIVAGERRWRAARLAGLTKVPVVVKEYDELEAEQVALVENLQREDLNAIEEAEGYLRLIEKFGFTQEQLSQRIGKSRSAITNSMRILKLPAKVLELIQKGELSQGHARAILGAESESAMIALAEKVVKQGLSVRQTEALAKGKTSKDARKPKKIDKNVENAIEECVKNLEKRFSSKVKIKYSDKFKGKIEIPFKNMEEMNKLFEMLDK